MIILKKRLMKPLRWRVILCFSHVLTDHTRLCFSSHSPVQRLSYGVFPYKLTDTVSSRIRLQNIENHSASAAFSMMEDLIKKQRRVRFSEPDHRDQHETGRTEKNWFERRLSPEMSWDDDYSVPAEYAAAVAASAFAVHSLEEAETENWRKMRADFEASRHRIKSKPNEVKPETTRRFSNREIEVSAKRSQESGYPRTSRTGSRNAQKQMGYTNRTEAKADAWERAQMEKIRKRHERTKSSILDWENEKKLRAKLSMEKNKAEIEQRKANNNEHYRIKIERIQRIAGGARAQAEERRKNEQFKVKEKAKRIRSGEATARCFCF